MLALLVASMLVFAPGVWAASTIVVNSTSDTSADDGSCTLREAIEAANTDSASGVATGECIAGSGMDTINFAITGTPDFTNNGQNGYTITPASQLPDITNPVTIDGTSQSGSSCGSPTINRTLLVELDGTSAGGSTNGLVVDNSSGQVSVRGLTVSKWISDGIRDQSSGSNMYTCNHVGVNPRGDVAAANNIGIEFIAGSDNSVVGGTNNTKPGSECRGDCNLLSGNTSNGLYMGSNDNSVLGNYICTDVTGLNAIPNGVDGNPGLGLIGSGSLIGNSTPQGRNIISGCSDGDGSSGSSEGISVEASGNILRGNYIGVDTTGLGALGSNGSGLVFIASSVEVKNSIIGGTSISDRNVISNNGWSNHASNVIFVDFGGGLVHDNTVLGNYIGTDASGEVRDDFNNPGAGIGLFGSASNNIVGGSTAGSGNLIAGNDTGVSVTGLSGLSLPLPLNNSVLGNSIYANNSVAPGGLGIDITDDSDGNFVPDSGLGINPNDPGDTDSGPNNFANYPVITDIATNGDNVTFTYSLDVNDAEIGATGYRVEFFGSDSADPLGNGEGQYYLGADNISGDVTGRQFTISNTGLETGNYDFAATSTATDGSSDGFGSTSEFSSVLGAEVTDITAGTAVTNQGNSSDNNAGSLAETGASSLLISSLAAAGFVVSIAALKRRRHISLRFKHK